MKRYSKVKMINAIEKILEKFNYISTKSEILISLVRFYLLQKEFNKSDNSFKEFISIIDLEPNFFARSKLLQKVFTLFLENLDFDDFNKVNNLLDTLLSKIESPYCKIDTWLKKLEFLLRYNKKEFILSEIGEIKKEIQKTLEVNSLILFNKLINPIKPYHLSKFFIDQTSLDDLNKKFAVCVSKIAIKISNENLFDLAFKRADFIKVKVVREDTIRDIINNYYFFALKTNDHNLTLKINKYSEKIKNPVCRIETLFNYTMCLQKQKEFNKIKEIIDSLFIFIPNVTGEFSRAVVFKELIKIIQNLEGKSTQIEYLNKVPELINKFQGIYSSLLIKLELIKAYYRLNKFEEEQDLFKEIILRSNLINDKDLGIKIIESLIDLIPNLKNSINPDLISFFISKINEIDDNGQKTKILLHLAENIENLNLEVNLKEITEILVKTSKPYVSDNVYITDHYYLFLKFSIKQAFKLHDKKILDNPLTLIEKTNSEVEKNLLILELIDQFKQRKLVEQLNYYQTLFMKQIDKISNEFEKKNVLIKFLNILTY